MSVSKKKIEWYLEFVDKHYKKKKSDLDVLFRYEPAKGITQKEAVGRIASESSVGTWTTLPGMPRERIEKLKACAYWYNDKYVKIAYPLELWETCSVPQIMSGIAGNIMGMKAIKNLKLIDATFPKEILKDFKGPVYGEDAIRKIFKKKRGPITSTVIKPKVGYTAKEHAELGYKIYIGGIDCIKDDENLTNQKFNQFKKRVSFLAKSRDRAEKETGNIKDAFINVTSPDLKELEKRIKIVHNHGFKYFMIDIVLSGFTATQTACELARDYKMAIHAHRAMHATFTRNPKHGISMLFLAKLSRIMGIDQIHTGTLIGKLEGSKEEIVAMKEMLFSEKIGEKKFVRLEQNFEHIKPSLPVSSGGLHPGILPDVFKIYGTTNIVLQIGGGVLGHPKGPMAGAKAVSQSIEAYYLGVKLEEYAKKHKELRQALDKWSHLRPI